MAQSHPWNVNEQAHVPLLDKQAGAQSIGRLGGGGDRREGPSSGLHFWSGQGRHSSRWDIPAVASQGSGHPAYVAGIRAGREPFRPQCSAVTCSRSSGDRPKLAVQEAP